MIRDASRGSKRQRASRVSDLSGALNELCFQRGEMGKLTRGAVSVAGPNRDATVGIAISSNTSISGNRFDFQNIESI